MNNREYLYDEFKKIGITLTKDQEERFILYYNELIKMNQVMNLTAITDFEEVVKKHFIDSVSIHSYLNWNEVNRMIDIGTGAGFPGIPLKVIFPGLNVTLLDSLKKRVGFLNQIIGLLDLDNIEAFHGRAEDYGKMDCYREKYDCCVSRAVANLSILAEYCIPFVKLGGYFIAYKSSDISEEIENSKKAAHMLGGEIKKHIFFQLSGTDIERSFVMIEKKKETNKKYPRKAGIPKKEPL